MTTFPEVPVEFYWEVTPARYDARIKEDISASVALMSKSKPEPWEQLPQDGFSWLGRTAHYDKRFYDFAFKNNTLRDSPYEIVKTRDYATHVRRNGIFVEQSAPLSDRFDEEELVRVANETLELWKIRQIQKPLYGTHSVDTPIGEQGATFQSKPRKVQAFQIEPDNYKRIAEFINGKAFDVIKGLIFRIGDNKDLVAQQGDWVVVEADGTVKKYTAEEFANEYEAI